MTPRPFPVAAVCVLGGIAILVTALLFAVDAFWAVPPTAGQRAIALAAIAATLAGLFGMWRMRRWGVYLVALLFGARLVVGVVGHLAWNAPALMGPTAILAVGLVYLRRMS